MNEDALSKFQDEWISSVGRCQPILQNLAIAADESQVSSHHESHDDPK